MNKNIIQFIVDENGQYISIPVGRVKAKSNLTTRIQLVTPITSSVAVNYLIYDSKNIEKKQYLIPTGELGSAVVDPKNPNYQLVSGWKVYEADIYAPILSVISKYRTGKVGMSFEFVEQVPNALCTNFVDYFGFTKPLPETANNGDYYICEDYNFWLNENLYNKGDILVWYNEQWNNGGILPKALTETVDISVDPAISYPTEEVDETAFGNAIGELAEDVAELDTRLNGVETDLNDKQDKVDLGLNTTVKTVVGGINEVKTQEEAHYNALNINKLDKNFNLLVERTFAQLTDFVAVRSGNDTLKMSLETLRTYLTQGLVGLSFVLVDELPPTGVAGVIYLVPSVESIVRVDTFEELPETGLENTIYITEDNNNRYQWNIDAEEYESYSHGYEEYIWLEELNKYELIGNTQVDLTGYATELWVTENFVAKTQLSGGTTGQVLKKKSDTDLDTEWGDLPQASGKKYATIVIGTSTAGHTSSEVDYLCDGIDDQVEIQDAINSLTGGGTIRFLNGTYNLSATPNLISNVSLFGGGVATIVQTSTSSFNYCFNIPDTATDVTIDGFRLSHAGSSYRIGISGYASGISGNITIKNNFVTDPVSQSSSLVRILYGKPRYIYRLRIINNTVIGNNSGVMIYSLQNAGITFKDAVITGNLYFARPRSSSHIMKNSIISNNKLGIGFDSTYFNISSGTNIIISNNNFDDSSTSNTDIVFGSGVSNSIVFGNTRCGVITDNGTNNLIGNNYFNKPACFNTLQVEKTPTLDNDVVRKVDLDDLTPDADKVAYNNATSGLTADNVQDALDELDNKTVEAVQVSYDNAMSGLSATNVQSAINELQSEKIDKADIVTTISGTPSDTKVASESAVYDALTSASGLTLSDNLDSPSSSVGLSTLGATKINGMQYLKTVNITVPADSEILTSSISTLIGEYFDTAYERFRIFVKFENINGLLVYFNDINSGGIFNKITGITTTSTTITDFPVIRNQAGYFDYINNGNGEEYLTYDNGDKIFTVKCNSVGSLWYRNQSISSSANFQLIVYKINGII